MSPAAQLGDIDLREHPSGGGQSRHLPEADVVSAASSLASLQFLEPIPVSPASVPLHMLCLVAGVLSSSLPAYLAGYSFEFHLIWKSFCCLSPSHGLKQATFSFSRSGPVLSPGFPAEAAQTEKWAHVYSALIPALSPPVNLSPSRSRAQRAPLSLHPQDPALSLV